MLLAMTSSKHLFTKFLKNTDRKPVLVLVHQDDDKEGDRGCCAHYKVAGMFDDAKGNLRYATAVLTDPFFGVSTTRPEAMNRVATSAVRGAVGGGAATRGRMRTRLMKNNRIDRVVENCERLGIPTTRPNSNKRHRKSDMIDALIDTWIACARFVENGGHDGVGDGASIASGNRTTATTTTTTVSDEHQ